MKGVKLGQHFIVKDEVVDSMILAAQITPNDKVIEIGTGHGELTSKLLRVGCRVISYEIDPGLYEQARTSLGYNSRLDLILGNAFEDSGIYDIAIASLPYYASRTFVEWAAEGAFDRAVVILQKDFLDKLVSKPGNRKYGPYSVIGQFCFVIRNILLVPPESFDPSPKVCSMIVRMDRKTRIDNSKLVARKLKVLFSYRGRKLSRFVKDLMAKGRWEGAMIIGDDLLEMRVEDLDPSVALRIAEGLRW